MKKKFNTKYLKDYKNPPYLIEKTFLKIHLDKKNTHIYSKLIIRKNPLATDYGMLSFNGEYFNTLDITLNQKKIDSNNMIHNNILSIPVDESLDEFIFEANVTLNPSENKALSGLYYSNNILTTQCEAQGFRRITWYFDRPDIMSIWDVCIIIYICISTRSRRYKKHIIIWII